MEWRYGKDKKIDPDRREVYRYMGYHGTEPDEPVREAALRCLEELEKVCDPRGVFREFPLQEALSGGETLPDTVRFADVAVSSRNLSRNLRQCTAVVLFAATLGPGPDQLIRRAGIRSLSSMVIYQAAAAAMVEKICDTLNEEIRERAAREGLFCRPRFSPGYGDFSLEHQKDFSRLLEMPKTAGITLTESLLMMPSKSVTAVIGLSPEEKPCPMEGCEACGLSSCAYRR